VTTFFAILLSLSNAYAGVFTHKTMIEPWPEQQVDQNWALPKGWLQIGLAGDTKSSSQYRDDAGAIGDYNKGTNWRYSRVWLRIDEGFSRRLRIYCHIPWVQAQLVNNRGTDTRTRAMGDVHTGFWFQPWIDPVDAETQSRSAVAFHVDLKAPSGVEFPSDFIGGSQNTESLLTGTGITNLTGEVAGRLRLGSRMRLDGTAAYVRKFPAVVGYVIEDNGFGNGWLNPGDEIALTGGTLLQITDDLAVGAEGVWSHRGTYAIGNSGEGTGKLALQDIAGTEGVFVDAGASISYEPTQHWEVQASGSMQVAGSDTRTFAHLGLEEFSPQPGLTTRLEVIARW